MKTVNIYLHKSEKFVFNDTTLWNGKKHKNNNIVNENIGSST